MTLYEHHYLYDSQLTAGFMADDAGTEVGMSFLCDTIIPLGPRIQGTFQLNANIQTVLI